MNRCSICGGVIVPQLGSGWDQGHNAQPINNGRCCDTCNDLVIVRRIHDAIASSKKKNVKLDLTK